MPIWGLPMIKTIPNAVPDLLRDLVPYDQATPERGPGLRPLINGGPNA